MDDSLVKGTYHFSIHLCFVVHYAVQLMGKNDRGHPPIKFLWIEHRMEKGKCCLGTDGIICKKGVF